MKTKGSLDQRFADQMGQLIGPDFPADIGLAVSGGGDSMAMLYLAHNWARVFGVRLWICTVDHGLRTESAAEAAMVAAECKALGWPHTTLKWTGWNGQGNLMAAARLARLRLIDRWRGGIEHVLFAHTMDDVAETFLMRLARGSGVEGLSAMSAKQCVTPHVGGRDALAPDEIVTDLLPPIPTRRVAGVPAFSGGFDVIRPLLGERRDALRHYLKVLQGRWVDDPTNEDDRFERARVRKLLVGLNGEGMDVPTLAATAHRMARAQEALQCRVRDVAKDVAKTDQIGDVLLDRDGFAGIERDTQMRLLAGALMWVSSADYRPRAEALTALLDRLLAGGGGTLQGCDCRCDKTRIRVAREYAAVQSNVVQSRGQIMWDNRWLTYCTDSQLTVRPLGDEGVAQLGADFVRPAPFYALRSVPGVFSNDQLVACSMLGFGDRPRFDLRPKGQTLLNFLFTH